MPLFYLDPALGNDLLGDGSLQAPFKSLEHIFGLDNTPGYTLIASTTVFLLAGNHVVNQCLTATGVANLVIQKYPNADVTITQNFDSAPLFDLTEMPAFTLSGVKIKSTRNTPSLIKITNCNLSKLTNLTFDALAMPLSPVDTKLIRLINTSTEISNVNFNAISAQNNLTAIAIENASIATLTSISATNMFCGSSGTLKVLDIWPNNLNISISNFTAVSLSGSDTYGVYADFAGTSTPFLLDNFGIRSVEFGVYLKNNPETHQANIKVRRGEIISCVYGIICDAASCLIYNNNISRNNFGLSAKTTSYVDSYNNIFFETKDTHSLSNTAAIRVSDSSEVKVAYSDFYANTTVYQEVSNGNVIKNEYIRFSNPGFTNPDTFDYTLLDNSPLIDIGRPVDYAVIGASVDIGKYDKDRLIPSDELPTALAKIVTRTYRAYDLGQVNVQTIISQILASIDPQMIAREGSSINDLMVKPHGIFYQNLMNTAVLIIRNQSLLAADYMTSQELDAFAANQYVTRNPGSLAYVTVRVYFQNPVAVVITPDDIFTTANNYRFYARNYMTITAGEMSGNIEGTLYFLDIPTEAETFGTAYNILSGEITTWVGAPSVVASVTNLTDAFAATDEEDNATLINRIKKSIGNRTLVHKTGIGAILAEIFPEVARTVAIGAGDPEMVRDIYFNEHFYGKTDVYISGTELAVAKYDLLNAQANTVLNRTTIGDVPIIMIDSIVVLDPDTSEPTDLILSPSQYSVAVSNPDNRFSLYENLTLTIDNAFVGTNLRLSFRWAPEIIAMHNFCQSDEQRILCEDLRVKHMIPVFLSMQINYKTSDNTDIDEAAAIAAIKYDINHFPAETEFQVSDIIDTMYGFSVDFVEQPLTVEAKYINADGTITTNYFVNTLTVPRIYGFIAGNITLNRLS